MLNEETIKGLQNLPWSVFFGQFELYNPLPLC